MGRSDSCLLSVFNDDSWCLCIASVVVHPLLTGGEVIPETFPSATIFFSSIDSFMLYTEHCSARQVDAVCVVLWQTVHEQFSINSLFNVRNTFDRNVTR